nr:Flp family type IVb pilin [uncultured Rhodopila sp.]
MLAQVFAVLRDLKTNRKGITALEYGVIAAALIGALATILGTLGTKINATFSTIAGKI